MAKTLGNRKVGIVGCGFVGSASAFSIMRSGLFSQMILIDYDKDRAEGEALDIGHGIPLSHPMEIKAGDYADLADAAVVVVTAGVGQKPGETRLDLVQRNVAVFKSIIPQINDSGFSGIMLIVSNPVDILTDIAMRLSNLPENQVLGSGTVLDSARLKYALGKLIAVDPRHVHARMLGEHGDSEFPNWGTANVSGIPIEKCLRMRGIERPLEKMDQLADEVRHSAYEIISKKGMTNYGIATCVTRILECIVRDEKSIMTVSIRVEDIGEAEGAVLSMPAVIGAGGVEVKVPLRLNYEELRQLKQSADTMREIMAQIDLG
ncbi:MAG: L-lactate dehydrogenase [Eggerthellaceae bacterium]|nr:L-lactate dehydrogenase [Eggerthellaceae bacterium]